VAVAVDTPTRRQAERVAPELAVAKLDLRDLALLAAFEILTEAEQHTHLPDHRRALAAAERILAEHATAPDRPVPEIARLFFSFTWVFPNLGLAGPFFAGETGSLKDAVLLAAREAIVSGVSARHDFHARLWTTSASPTDGRKRRGSTFATSRSTRSRRRRGGRPSSATAGASTP
jgi:uncharacterized membrane protein